MLGLVGVLIAPDTNKPIGEKQHSHEADDEFLEGHLQFQLNASATRVPKPPTTERPKVRIASVSIWKTFTAG